MAVYWALVDVLFLMAFLDNPTISRVTQYLKYLFKVNYWTHSYIYI